MIYPNNPLYLLSLLGYIYYLTYYTLTTKDNIIPPFKKNLNTKRTTICSVLPIVVLFKNIVNTIFSKKSFYFLAFFVA